MDLKQLQGENQVSSYSNRYLILSQICDASCHVNQTYCEAFPIFMQKYLIDLVSSCTEPFQCVCFLSRETMLSNSQALCDKKQYRVGWNFQFLIFFKLFCRKIMSIFILINTRHPTTNTIVSIWKCMIHKLRKSV